MPFFLNFAEEFLGQKPLVLTPDLEVEWSCVLHESRTMSYQLFECALISQVTESDRESTIKLGGVT